MYLLDTEALYQCYIIFTILYSICILVCCLAIYALPLLVITINDGIPENLGWFYGIAVAMVTTWISFIVAITLMWIVYDNINSPQISNFEKITVMLLPLLNIPIPWIVKLCYMCFGRPTDSYTILGGVEKTPSLRAQNKWWANSIKKSLGKFQINNNTNQDRNVNILDVSPNDSLSVEIIHVSSKSRVNS